jgi:hypothetical protein
MLAGFTNGVKVPRTIPGIPGLMIMNRLTLVPYDLQQGYDVGVNLFEQPSDPFDANPAGAKSGDRIISNPSRWTIATPAFGLHHEVNPKGGIKMTRP